MNLFLTSNIGGIKKVDGKKIADLFSNENNFLDELKNSLKDYKKFVLVASNPHGIEQNSFYLELDKEALNMSGLYFDEYVVLDDRNKNKVEETLKDASLIFLCGGDTYVQNMFFNEIDLKKYISNIDASIVGISAGSINSADVVFNSPEKKEDLEHPCILSGLSLTNLNIEPHFELNNTNEIQVNAIMEESYNRVIYGIPDGSYIKNNKFFGRCYKVFEGKIEEA
ncbi:MAG: Type 1 glutamine amidotransferase-like domain-containing protein [Clostridia bacterium]|nr:Type 1 glutamine amidotransferase-like domain-containing protein [Clostridia bacterium]